MNNSELANRMTHPTARRIGRLLAVVLVIITVMLTLTSIPASASKQTAARPAAPAQHTLLVTLYSDANFMGPSRSFFGPRPCDAGGYTFIFFSSLHVSSIRGYDHCNAVELTNREGISRRFRLPVRDLSGTGYQDNVTRIRVFYWRDFVR